MFTWLRYLLRPNDDWEFEHDYEGRRWEYLERVDDGIHEERWFVRWSINDEFLESVAPERIPAIIIRNLARLVPVFEN